MAKTIGIVEAQCANRILPARMGRKLAGKSLLEWSVRHATDAQCLDSVVVAADRDAMDWIRKIVPQDVPVVAGTPRDVLAHFIDILDQYPAHSVVRIPGDNPFLDPALIDRLVATADDHLGCDYISYHAQRQGPAIHAPLGMLGEWCRAEALRVADADAADPFERQHATHYLFAHPERFTARWIPAPEPFDRHDLRLALDVEEDWDHAEAIFDALGQELDSQRIARFLAHQPALRERMAELNRACA